MREWRERCIQKNPFVAVIQDRIVAMAELEEDGFIDYFYVSPDFRQDGKMTDGKMPGKIYMAKYMGQALCLFAQKVAASPASTSSPGWPRSPPGPSPPSLLMVTPHVEEILPCLTHVLLLNDGQVTAKAKRKKC